MMRAPVPRNLRVRSSIQISSTRVPARAFLICAGLLFGGGMLIVFGAEMEKTIECTAVLIVAALGVFELRLWGRSTPAVVSLLWRHYARPKRLVWEQNVIVLPPQTLVSLDTRRPRWQVAQDEQRAGKET